MDRQKLRELLKQAHPKHRVVEPEEAAPYAAEAEPDDADVSNLSAKTWKKFETTPAESPAASTAHVDELRERFRPRKLTGAGPASTPPADQQPPSRTPGKLTLERLVPEDAPADTDESLDVLVDEEHGIIGESDSGPDDED